MNSKIPPGWSAVDLTEVVDIAYGKNLPTTKLIDKGFAVYGANGQIGFYSEYNCEESEVLITCRGATCGTINVSPPKTFVTNNSMVLRPHDPTLIDRNYLRAAMLATDKSKVITGTAQPQITVANLSKHRIELAPLNEQRRIIAKVEELTARSRAAKEALDAIPPLLERFRQSVLAAAFRGDLTKRWREQNPDVEPASVLLERIRQERRQRWEQDYLAQQKAKGKTPKDDKWKEKYQEPEPVDTRGLPELPEGWCWASLDDAGIWSSGGTPSRSEPGFYGGEIPWAKTGDLNDGTLLQIPETITALGVQNSSAKVFPAGTLLVAMYGATIGNLGFLGLPAATNQACAALLPDPQSSISRQFIFYWLLSERQKLRMLGQGGAQPNISQGLLREYPIPVPPLIEQRHIESLAGARLHQIEIVAAGLREGHDRLTSLNQSILAKAFRGELVPQDPNDEPASVLLERIRAEREAKTAGDSDKKRKARK